MGGGEGKAAGANVHKKIHTSHADCANKDLAGARETRLELITPSFRHASNVGRPGGGVDSPVGTLQPVVDLETKASKPPPEAEVVRNRKGYNFGKLV